MKFYISFFALFSFAVAGGLIIDEFSIDRAAGSVDSTLSETGGDLRRVITVETNIAVSEGRLLLTNSGGGGTFYYRDSIQRIPGAIIKYQWKGENYASNMGTFGLVNTALTPLPQSGLSTNNGSGGATGIYCGSSTTYPRLSLYLAINRIWKFTHVLRNYGQFVFIKKDSTWNNDWKLRWVDELSSAAYLTFYAGSATSTRTLSFDNLFLSANRLYNVVPASSDAFTRADGAMDTTDGLGHAEANGGSGDAWTDKKGTWAVKSNQVHCADTTGGGQKGISVISADRNSFIECSLWRSVGNAGIVARYRNDSNYLRLYHDGTNCKLDKVVNNVVTNLQSTVIAYSAGAVLKLFCDTIEYSVSYNNVNAGVGNLTDTSLYYGVQSGLYTTDSANRFDNFVCWNARGYSDLDTLVDTTKILLDAGVIPVCMLSYNRTVIGGGTIDTLKMANGVKLTLEAAKKLTLTAVDTGGMNGASGALDSIVSSTSAACTLSAPQCTLRYVYFKNVYSSNKIYASDGTSIDGGGNTNIVFTSGRSRASRYGFGHGFGIWIMP